jgi:hypothetical protein
MKEFEDPQAQLEDRQYNVQKKKDNHWYTKHYTENYHPPPPLPDFFTGNKNQIFIFWAYKKIALACITVEMKPYTSCFVTVSFIRPVLLVDETGVAWKSHRPVTSHWQTLSHRFKKKITPNKTTLSIIIKCGGILLF